MEECEDPLATDIVLHQCAIIRKDNTGHVIGNRCRNSCKAESFGGALLALRDNETKAEILLSGAIRACASVQFIVETLERGCIEMWKAWSCPTSSQ